MGEPEAAWRAGDDDQGGPTSVAILRWDDPATAVTIEFGPAPLPVETHAMPVPGFGPCTPAGRFTYRPLTDDVQLTWPSDGDAVTQQAIRATPQRLVTASDVTGPAPPTTGIGPLDGPLSLAAAAPYGLLDMNAPVPCTFHPLGGAVLGRARDAFGRVDGHPGPYVTDASLIPGSTGACNPALTIAALAERCLDDIVAHDVGTVF